MAQRTRTYTADIADLVVEDEGVPVEELTVEEEAPSATSRFLSGAGEMLNPITAIKGIANAVAHPIDTAGAIVGAHKEQFGKARQAFDEGRLVEAAGHGMAGVLPVIGPAAANVGEQIAQGDVAGGLGAATGLVAGAGLAGPATRAAGKAIRPVAKRAGEALYQSALKPTKAVLKHVRTAPGGGEDAARQTLIQAGLQEGIPVSASGARKVESLVDSLNAEVQQRIAEAGRAGKAVDPTHVEQAIRDVAKDFTHQINAQPELAAIETVRSNFMANPNVAKQVQGPAGKATVMQDIPVERAQEMKVNTYKGLRGKYGRELGGTIEAEKAGARGLREGIEREVPEVGPLNAREGAMIPLEEAIADAMRRRGNYAMFGLTPLVGAIPAITHGNMWPLLAALVDRAPGVVSRTGIWINRTGQRSGRMTQGAATTTAAANATSSNESRSRTRGRAFPEPEPAR
jgi:hypothetical protein